jgi:hypothetical protein
MAMLAVAAVATAAVTGIAVLALDRYQQRRWSELYASDAERTGRPSAAAPEAAAVGSTERSPLRNVGAQPQRGRIAQPPSLTEMTSASTPSTMGCGSSSMELPHPSSHPGSRVPSLPSSNSGRNHSSYI